MPAETSRLPAAGPWCSLDVADAASVFAAAAQIVERWGRLDVWVNNAMATVFGPADCVSPHEWARVTEVTYLGRSMGRCPRFTTCGPSTEAP